MLSYTGSDCLVPDYLGRGVSLPAVEATERDNMPPKPRRVAVRFELEWSYRRHTATFAGAAQYAEEQGWDLIIDEYAEEALPTSSDQELPFDGVIARAPKKLADRASRLSLPVVNVWYSSPVRDRIPGVFPDLTAIGRMGAEHLLARGLRRFAGLKSHEAAAQSQQLEGFCAAVGDAPCSLAETPLRSLESLAQWRKTQRAIDTWMNDWETPIGVYIGPLDLSRTVVQMCRARGWRVPEDVAIVVGDNEQAICEMPRPTLTGIDVGYDRIGYEAARLLDELMKERDEPPGNQKPRAKRNSVTKHLYLPPQGLVVRESTDFVAVEDAETAAALEFISGNSHLPIRVDDVARAVAMEPRTLQLRFRKHLNRPIADEIRRVRIERAKRELSQTERSMAEIARAVGFRDPQRMYEVFVRELGVSPTQYRKDRQVRGQEV